jgi:phosphatidylglycerophosphate synthase
MWESILHQIIPNLIIILCSITLILRILWQKHRMHQPIQWRKHRKMTLQLISISLIYLIFSFPNIAIIFIQLSGLSNSIDPQITIYTDLFTYLVILCFPFVCIFSLPELLNKIKKILPLKNQRQRARSIFPEMSMIRNNINNQNVRHLENIVH